MRKLSMLWSAVAAGALAVVAAAGGAEAATVTGTGYETTSGFASNATPSSVAFVSLFGGPSVTFSVSNVVSFNPTDSTSIYTLGSWLSSAGATSIAYHNGAASGDSLGNTLWNFTGTGFVTSGQNFSILDDDGVTLVINGQTVISSPGPQSETTNSGTYTGPTGTFAFQLVYGECCGAPATLQTTLPGVTATPLPAALPLFAGGLGALGLLGWRRKRKAPRSVA